MRDVALMAVFVVLLTQALRHTWCGVLLWTWLSLMNPHRLTYGFAFDFPFAAITAGVTFLSLLWNRDKVRLPADPVIFALVLFVLWTCVTTLAAVFPEQSYEMLSRTFKIQLMTLLCIAALRERKHIEWFIWVNVLSIGYFGFKGGIFGFLTEGSFRVWGPQNSFIEDNNSLGLAIVMTIPLMNYLRQQSTRPWVRHGLLLLMVVCVVSVLSSQSRGAFLAIVAMSFVLWTRMKRKLLPAIAMILVGAALLAFMPSAWEERMQTIGDYEKDTSAVQRLNAWTTAIHVANDRITGAGFAIANGEVFGRYAPNPDWVHTAHSIYFQALGEHGWIGLVLFLSLGALGFRNAARLRKRTPTNPETTWLHDLAGMIQVSMVGYAVGGAFLSLAYFDLPYNILVIIIASKYWLREERWKIEPPAEVLVGDAPSARQEPARTGPAGQMP